KHASSAPYPPAPYRACASAGSATSASPPPVRFDTIVTTAKTCIARDRRSRSKAPSRLMASSGARAEPDGSAPAEPDGSAPAEPDGSAGAGRRGRRGMSARDSADTANEPASTANAGPDPTAATSAPPSAGPSSEPVRIAASDTPLPAAIWRGSSNEGRIVLEDGMYRPSPAPIIAASG